MYNEVKATIQHFVETLMEREGISPADMKVILYEIGENINPYVSVEELLKQKKS